MKSKLNCTIALSLVAAGNSLAQSAWLPEKNQLLVTPGYTFQTFDKFRAGETEVSLGDADVTQHTGYVNMEYGILRHFAADVTLGYVNTSTDFAGFTGGGRKTDDGLADTLLGLRYRIIDEFAQASSYVPTVTLRVGGIIAGTYDENFPFSSGDGANGFETALLFGKAFGKSGFGAFGGIGYRTRDHDVPDDVFGNAGVYQQVGPVTLSFGYQHVQGLSGGDIGDPGFNPAGGPGTFGFPQTKEINQLVEGSISYTDKGGRTYQASVGHKVDGRNTGDKLIVGFSITMPFSFGH